MKSSTAVIREERRQRAVESLGLSGVERNPALDRVTRMARTLFGVDMSAVTVIDGDRAFYPGRAGFDLEQTLRADAGCHLVIDSGEIVATADARADSRFADITPFIEDDLAFYIGHPLLDGSGHVVGSFCLVDRKPRVLTADELEQFEDFAAWAQSELVADSEGARARETQQALFPSVPLVANDVRVEGVCIPALSVGGDYFDYGLVGNSVHLALGDVMGKGVGAAILGASTRSAARAVVAMTTEGRTLGAAVERIERAILADLDRLGSFVTYFHAMLDLETGILSYVDAGAGLTLLLRADGNVEHLLGSAMPLGIVQQEITAECTAFGPGDRLVMVSDGVLDVLANPSDWQTELARLVRESGDGPGLLAAVRELSEDRVGRDDVTVVILERGL